MRKLIRDAHMVSAFGSGLVLLVLCLSGCLLVFEKRIDVWTDSNVSLVQPSGAMLRPGLLAAKPGTAEFHFPDGPSRSAMLVAWDGTRIYLDPASGVLLGARRGGLPSVRLRQLHKNLLMGRNGGWLVAGATWLLLFQSVSGIYLWWPLKRIAVKTGASWRRVAFDLHHSAGFFSSMFVATLALTGLVRYYPELTEKMFAGEPAGGMERGAERNEHVFSIDQAVAIARREFPGARLVRVNFPKTARDPWVVSARYDGDLSPFGLSWVNLDARNGELLSKQDLRHEAPADAAQRIARMLHTGEAGGAAGQALAFLSSLAVLLELVTGCWMWWARTRRKARRPPAGTLAPSPETIAV